MRILCFLADLEGGGAERTMLNLCRGFAGVGAEPILVTADATGKARNWLDERIELIDLGVGRARYAPLPFIRVLKRLAPDILFSTKLDANIISSFCRTIMGSSAPPHVVRETNSHRARADIGLFRRLAARGAYSLADRVVALSEGVRKELIDDMDLSPDRVRTIHNPVDIAKCRDEATKAGANPRPFGNSVRIVMAAGRLTRQKGFDLLLSAFAMAHPTRTKLVIAGTGPDEHALKRQAKVLGISDVVLFPGFVESPCQLFAHADIFILPSRWEGFGHVIAEAMASGTPVIATDCPHGPRDIIFNGQNGVLVKNGDVVEMAGAMSRLLNDPVLANQLAASAQVNVGRFAMHTISQQYIALFNELRERD